MNNNSVSTRTYPVEPNHFQLVKIAELADMRKRPEVTGISYVLED